MKAVRLIKEGGNMYANVASGYIVGSGLRDFIQRFSWIIEELRKLLSGVITHRGRTDSNG